jgi:hypothetical protein
MIVSILPPLAGHLNNKALIVHFFESGASRTLARCSATALVGLVLVAQASAQQAPSPQPVEGEDAGRLAGQLQAFASSPVSPSAPGSVQGVILGRDGEALEGARVELTSQACSSSCIEFTQSDDQGRFSVSHVAPGAFTLTISSPGFVTQTTSGTVAPGQAFDAPPVILPIMKASVEVVVSASQHEIAQEQLHEEEKQRVLGIVPNFYVAYAPDAAPLSAAQKFHLSLKSMVDPTTFLGSAFSAGIEQHQNQPKGFGQGAAGFSRRFAADYGDNLIGTMIGSALLPAVLKQDPHYFYKGTGSVLSRVLYAAASSVMCKSDSGHWQPDYSRIVGSLAGKGISQLYYPASDRKGAPQVFASVAIGKATGAAQNIIQEFFVRRFTRHLPDYHPANP